MHNPDIIPIFFLFFLGFWLLPDQDRDLQDKAQRGCAPPFLEAPPKMCPSCMLRTSQITHTDVVSHTLLFNGEPTVHGRRRTRHWDDGDWQCRVQTALSKTSPEPPQASSVYRRWGSLGHVPRAELPQKSHAGTETQPFTFPWEKQHPGLGTALRSPSGMDTGPPLALGSAETCPKPLGHTGNRSPSLFPSFSSPQLCQAPWGRAALTH